jgi:hypothetical protein
MAVVVLRGDEQSLLVSVGMPHQRVINSAAINLPLLSIPGRFPLNRVVVFI